MLGDRILYRDHINEENNASQEQHKKINVASLRSWKYKERFILRKMSQEEIFNHLSHLS